jgi:hypothetical protein
LGRAPDSELICHALDVLKSANSLNEFYSTKFNDLNNNVKQILGCVDAATTTLITEEKRYVLFVEKIMGMFTPDRLLHIADEVKHRHILALAKGFPAAAISDSYIYFSYILHRALRFIRGKKTTLSKSAYNDYEDGGICLHLSLVTPYCIVTDDAGARCALNETVSLIGRLNDPQFRTALKIRDAKHLRDL